MASECRLELSVPIKLSDLRMPQALNARLTELLDKQDSSGQLTPKERREAEGLVEVSELLSLLRIGARIASVSRKQ